MAVVPMNRAFWLLLLAVVSPVAAQSYDYVRPGAPILRPLPAVPPSQVLPPPPLGSSSQPLSKPISRQPTARPAQPTKWRQPAAKNTMPGYTRQPAVIRRKPEVPVQVLDEVEVLALRERMLEVSFDQYPSYTSALMGYGEALSRTRTGRNRAILPSNDPGVTVLEVVLYPDYGGGVQMRGPVRIIQSGGPLLDQAALQAVATQAQSDLGSWPYSMKRQVRYRITVNGQTRNFTCALAEILYGKT